MDSEQAGAVTMESPSRVAQWLMPGWKRALKTISMLGAATAVGAVCVFLTQTLLARELGPQDYGLFASSLATITMIAPLAGFGLAQFRLRVYGVEGWSARRWIAPSLRFTVGTAILSIAIIVGWALFVAPDADTRFDLLVLIPVVLHILTIEMLSTKYRLEDRYARMAGWQLAIPVSRLLVALVLLLVPQLTGRFVATSYAVISLAMVAWALPLLRSVMRGEIDLRGHGPEPTTQAPVQEPRVSELWTQAWPFGMIAILYPVFFQVSTILLKYLGSDKQAGFWAIGLAIMTAIYLIPATIYQKFLLSKLHRWAVHDPVKFWMVYKRGNVGMFALGILRERDHGCAGALRDSARLRRALSRRHRHPDRPVPVPADPVPLHLDGLGAAHRQAHALPRVRHGLGHRRCDFSECRLDPEIRRDGRRLGDGHRRTGAVGGDMARR